MTTIMNISLTVIPLCVILICLIGMLPKKKNKIDDLFLGDYRIKGLIDNALLLRHLKNENEKLIKKKGEKKIV